jgi:electron transfer flavoprotein beta subunit
MTTTVAACVKWVDLRPDVDPVHGTVAPSAHGWGFSPADRAAVEVALRLAATWGGESVVVCSGPPAAAAGLAELVAAGAGGAVLVEQPFTAASAHTAEELAAVLGPGDLGVDAIVCGDLSYDRGSGSVPAFLAHQLGLAQALGLIAVDPDAAGAALVRRLDGARREELRVGRSCVLSVEGAVANLRRGSLDSALGGAAAAGVERRTARQVVHVDPPRTRPLRPRARVLAAPEGGDAFERILQLTDAVGDRTPPRTVEAKPAEAAALILEQLREWGYLDDDPGAGS